MKLWLICLIYATLGGKNPSHIFETFDLNRIAGGVTKEHRPLLTRLPLKPS